MSTWLAVKVSIGNKQLAEAVHTLEGTNDQLTAAFQNWQQELYQRVLVAAFSEIRSEPRL